MAAETISCPDCGRKLRVPDELLGKLVKCPSCGQTFTANAAKQPSGQVPYEQPPWEDSAPEPAARRSAAEFDEGDDEEEGEEDRDQPRRRRRRRRQYQMPHRGGVILALGLCALFTGLGFVLGPIAWIMGNNDLREMRAGRMDPEGESNTQAGRICGMIATILYIVSLGFCIAYFCVVFGIFALVGIGGAAAK